jgi:hypothetical protein
VRTVDRGCLEDGGVGVNLCHVTLYAALHVRDVIERSQSDITLRTSSGVSTGLESQVRSPALCTPAEVDSARRVRN